MGLRISPALAKELKKHIMDYPSLFKTGGSVLVHIFCVNGNGMEWVDGEPVLKFQEDKIGIYDSFGKYLRHYLRGMEETPSRVKLAATAYEEEIDIRLTAVLRSYDKRVYYRYVPNNSKDTLLNTAPKDIKPIWKEAIDIVNEMKEWYPIRDELDTWKRAYRSIE